MSRMGATRNDNPTDLGIATPSLEQNGMNHEKLLRPSDSSTWGNIGRATCNSGGLILVRQNQHHLSHHLRDRSEFNAERDCIASATLELWLPFQRAIFASRRQVVGTLVRLSQASRLRR